MEEEVAGRAQRERSFTARALERRLAQLRTYRVRACARSSSSGASLAPSRVVTVDSRAEGTKTLRAALVSRLTKPAAGVRRPRPTKDCERLGPEMNPSLTTNQHHHDRCSHRETIRSVRSRCGSALRSSLPRTPSSPGHRPVSVRLLGSAAAFRRISKHPKIALIEPKCAKNAPHFAAFRHIHCPRRISPHPHYAA